MFDGGRGGKLHLLHHELGDAVARLEDHRALASVVEDDADLPLIPRVNDTRGIEDDDAAIEGQP